MLTESDSTPGAIRDRVRAFLAEHDPAEMPRQDFNNARFDAGLAWVHYPEGLGGLGAPRTLQNVVDAEFAAAGAPGHNAEFNVIGLGMAAPTILAYGSDEQQKRWLRSLWTGEEIWCQLFSEPGAGSDLAALATRAVQDGEEWVANGQKVWTSLAQHARRALLVARPELRTPGLHDRMMRLWTEAEVARLAGERLRQQLAAGKPGPEGSAAKLVFARLNQEISGFEVELAGADGLRYDDWTMRRPEHANFYGRGPGYRYLRARGNSIEGGTSEILRNIVAERVLGLPAEPRVDRDVPWKDLPR